MTDYSEFGALAKNYRALSELCQEIDNQDLSLGQVISMCREYGFRPVISQIGRYILIKSPVGGHWDGVTVAIVLTKDATVCYVWAMLR